jgi:hypothetical protein
MNDKLARGQKRRGSLHVPNVKAVTDLCHQELAAVKSHIEES